MKKLVSLLLALMLLLSAAGFAEAEKPGIPADVLNTPLFRTTPANLECFDWTEPVTLSIMINAPYDTEYVWGEDPITQEITRLTGITLEGVFASDWTSTDLTLMLASEEELPDIITALDTSFAQYNEMVDAGLLYPLNELIDEYCPLMWESMFEIEKNAFRDENGNMWSMNQQNMYPKEVDTNLFYEAAYCNAVVRSDIYEALGSPALNTPEDVLAFLKLFNENKEQWPEIAYPYLDLVMQLPGNITCADNMFGGKNYRSGFGTMYKYDAATNTVINAVETESGKQALKFYWDIAQLGGITQANFAGTIIEEELKGGKALIAFADNIGNTARNANMVLAENGMDYKYQMLMPVQAEGSDFHFYSTDFRLNNVGAVITKNCSNPERAIELFEFLNSEYGHLLVWMGIYGEHWNYTEYDDGTIGIAYTEKADEGAERDALGIYNYKHLLFGMNCSNYDYFNDYCLNRSSVDTDPINFELEKLGQSGVSFLATNHVTFAADSDETLRLNKVNEILGNYVTKIILSDTEDSFNANYQEMIDVLHANGLEEVYADYAAASKAWYDECVSFGVEFYND